MNDWNGWPLERITYVFLGVAYAIIGLQLTLNHAHAKFHNRFMWAPVLYTPLLVIVALAHAFSLGEGVQSAFVVLFWGGVLEGLAGTYFHLRGIARMPGGLTKENVQKGPPFLLSIVYAALSAFGLLVHHWPNLSST